ncbi:MAG: helix-turn-helix transcriptional regulator [Clostridia bacterium]|nr:helix-turn-helix transcriptional regulator [Clostridia bacterium]
MFHQPDNSVGNYNYNTRIYSGITWDSHFHGNFELIYSISGTTKVCVNDKDNILECGEALLIFPYTTHSISVDKNSKNWIGVFSDDHIPYFAEKNKNIRYSKFRFDEHVESLLKNALFIEGSPDRYILCACLYTVCSQCVKNALSFPLKQNDDFRQKVLEYISEHLNLNITLKETAAALNYEYHYFSFLFHDCFSMNFKSFINHFRFEKACKALASSDKTVTDICAVCGFGSIRNFNRVFKSLCGMTPCEYRESISDKQIN